MSDTIPTIRQARELVGPERLHRMGRALADAMEARGERERGEMLVVVARLVLIGWAGDDKEILC